MTNPRLYFGLKGTGEIKGSAEAVAVYEIIKQTSETIGEYVLFECLTDDMYTDCYIGDEIEIIQTQGYTNQRYAIELRGIRVEDRRIGLPISEVNPFNQEKTVFKYGCKQWSDNANCSMAYGLGYVQRNFMINRLPQSFIYIDDPHTGELAILYSIHQKWFDMIADGAKNFEFRSVLPRALRENQQI